MAADRRGGQGLTAVAPGPIDETSPRYRGWRVVVACFLMALSIFGFAIGGHGLQDHAHVFAGVTEAVLKAIEFGSDERGRCFK